MQQLTQQLKSGKMQILEVPFPALGDKQVLVRNHFSVISPGTEGKTVSDARKGYLAKARSRQKEVKQVIDMVRTSGIQSTYKLVMNKLEAESALGYSSAGEVIAVGKDVKAFKSGDKVCCGGANACHADVIAVPEKLCVLVPPEVDLSEAAFSTIASIAIQGIRQADLKLGEYAVVIGMGLIGQITARILEASGIRCLGVEIDQQQIELCKSLGINRVVDRNRNGISEQIINETGGHGADAVLITAATSSLDPVNFAGEIARKKGKVVIVGAVPTGFDRKNYYRKELDLLMSSSYGPGRYDPDYEEKGLDYPIGYVRWTENRNMQSFVDLLSLGKLEVKSIITHTFPLLEAPEAYQMILEKTEAFAGIIINYDQESELKREVRLSASNQPEKKVRIGFLGAGSFAQNILLPALSEKADFVGLATARGNSSRYVGEKYGFSYCSDDASAILEDESINTTFIATRHHMHADAVIKSLQKGKHVFVEKPLALNLDELEQVRSTYNDGRQKGSGSLLMVGFNRRFAPFNNHIWRHFEQSQAKSILIRVNAGKMPSDHWVNDPQVGGGRIIGEACHFIDLACYFAGGKALAISAHAAHEPAMGGDSVVVSMEFDNGSIASISYNSNGNKLLPKERIEISGGGTVCVIDDYKTLSIYGKKIQKIKSKVQDKGHTEEIDVFINAITEGKESPIDFNSLYQSSWITLKVDEAIRSRRTILI